MRHRHLAAGAALAGTFALAGCLPGLSQQSAVVEKTRAMRTWRTWMPRAVPQPSRSSGASAP